MRRALIAVILVSLAGCAHQANIVASGDRSEVSRKQGRAPAAGDLQGLQGPMGEMSPCQFRREVLGEDGDRSPGPCL